MLQINIWKYIGAIVVVVGILFGSYSYGYNEAVEDTKLEEFEKLQAAQEANLILNKKLSDVSIQLAETKSKVIVKEKIVTNKVIEYVQDPNRVVCNYDDKWLQLKQSIINNADPRE